MESPSRALSLNPPSPSLSPNNSVRRRRSSNDSNPTNSPEFEFWNIVKNPSFPQPLLLSADELFSDGFLLPLNHKPGPESRPKSEPGSETGPSPVSEPKSEPDSETGPSPESEPSALITSEISSNPILTASKRWKEIFKRGEKKTRNSEEKLEKRRDRKNRNGNVSSSAELNINIWPFSRSRSAGNNSRPAVQTGRKVSSAPCSRSNSSGGDSKSRRSCPSSPGRTGVHLGRTSPVWQVRRSNRPKPNDDKGRVLPVCMGYRQHLSCRSDGNGGFTGGGSGGGGGRSGEDSSGSNGNLFSLRGLFGKKSTVLTV